MIYPKFKQGEACAFPDRLDCNGDADDCKTRCPYMKYNNLKSIFDSTRWECRYKVHSKSELSIEQSQHTTKQEVRNL